MAEPVSVARNVAEALLQWAREESGRMSERASENASAVLRELGFVTHREHEELELRVAQLEHRLRLLESATAPVTLAGDGAATEDTESRPSL
jgi:polyhydroxyalkanoate synthesis regulator phasin